jgi:hypothetical protein
MAFILRGPFSECTDSLRLSLTSKIVRIATELLASAALFGCSELIVRELGGGRHGASGFLTQTTYFDFCAFLLTTTPMLNP